MRNQTFQPTINPSEVIAKQVAYPPDSYSRRELNVRTLWLKMKIMVSPMKLTVLSATPKQLSQFANPSHLKTGRSESNFAPLWRVLAEQLKILFPDEDDEGAFIVPALDARSQVLSIKDRRNGIGKPVFKLARFGSAQLFKLVAPDGCVLRVPGEV